MIDLHCHVLPGIDDGPPALAGSLALARAARERGIGTLVATPHVSWHYRNTAAGIAEHVQALRSALAAEGIELDVRAGAEIAMTYLPELDPQELRRLRLGGGGYLLVEPPFAPVLGPLEALVDRLQEDGHRVLLAHPERCPAFQRDPGRLAALVRRGVLTSITAGSLVGRFGAVPRRVALELVERELVHNVTSDAHDVHARAPGMAAELAQAGLEGLTEWLTDAVPAAILEGGAIPPRPQLLRAGRLRRLRWRVRRA